MKINEKLLKEYIGEDEIYEFNSEAEFLEMVNDERKMFWSDVHPNEFKTFDDTKSLGGEYILKYKDKYYWIAYEHCLDIYE